MRRDSGRGSRPWVRAEQCFRSPYLGQRNWKVGQRVIVKRFGDFPCEPGEIVKMAGTRTGSYKVKVDRRSEADWVPAKKLFNEVRPARLEELKAGDVVSKKPGYWALVMGMQGAQVVVRQGPTDSLVPVD